VLKRGLKKQALWIAIALGCFALASAAAQDMPQHTPEQAGADPAMKAYLAASERMHRDMAIEFTGDPDVDFARAMIPHHQGAIDMAQAVLSYGQDPEILALAEGIIAAQEQEIAVLRSWLEKRGQNGG
jgi:uncharacterized protein (DUF305 family)